ncbi:MAG TPA: hypothetical protein VHD57_08160 [Vicinamibacterales bacterium]|jgi:hypothetical protein|nr:hypothetical protein [Vicinamibacterales bacterium]
MCCRTVGFEHGTCLVEIQPEAGTPSASNFTAFLSLVEDNGTVIRPLVLRDGHRVRIRASSEPVALESAIRYLESRFGAKSGSDAPCALGRATIGRPVAVAE